MALVFISHASEDNEKVQEVTDYIKKNGFDFIFLDYDKKDGIKVGEDWEKRLYHELKRSHAIVVLLSPAWIKSTWCRIEYSQAKALGKEIIPIIIDNGEENEVNKWLDDHIQRSDLTSDKEVLSRVLERIKEIALDTQKGFKWNQNRSPYPGLLSFEEQDAAIFFGREDESREIIQKLKAMQHHNAPKLLNIVAASGMGKSSLLKAGVLPKLKLSYANEWEVLPPFRPTTRPLYEFSKFIAKVLSKQGEYKSIYKALQGAFYKEVLDDIVTELEFLSLEKKSILFALDQAEELYSLSDEEEKAFFLQALGYLLEHKENFFAIWTLRSDFLKEYQLDASSKELHRLSEIFSLNALSQQSITSVIREPAKVAGMSVDDELIEKIKEDLTTTDALPILALCLNELYHKHKKSGHLTLSHYENLTENGTNPLENIIKEKANEAIKAFKDDNKVLLALKSAFIPHLIRVNSENEYIKRVAKLAELPEEAHKVIESLVKQRLLITKNIEDEEFVEIAHEALIREWVLLQEWLKDEHNFLIGKSKLERSLLQWKEKNKPNNALLLGVELENALLWKEKLYDADEIAYVKRSIEHDKQTKKRRKLFFVLTFTFITLFALLSFWQMNVAKENEKKAQNLLYKGTMEQGFIYKNYFDDAVKAKHLFARGIAEGTSKKQKNNGKIVYNSFQNSGELENIFEYNGSNFKIHNFMISSVIVSKDEKQILSWNRDNIIKLWSIDSDKALLVLKHDDSVMGAIFSKDEKQILSWS